MPGWRHRLHQGAHLYERDTDHVRLTATADGWSAWSEPRHRRVAEGPAESSLDAMEKADYWATAREGDQ